MSREATLEALLREARPRICRYGCRGYDGGSWEAADHWATTAALTATRQELADARTQLTTTKVDLEMQREALRGERAENAGYARREREFRTRLDSAVKALEDVADRLESASALLVQEGYSGEGEVHTSAGDAEAIARARAAVAAARGTT